MFKSKARPIVIPQSEHARLAGAIAYLWGNHAFDPPPLDRMAFVSGVTHHDRGYGVLDNIALGEASDAVWLATQERGITTALGNPVADVVALLHIRRLLANKNLAAAKPLVALAEQHIESQIQQTSYDRETFDRADTITNLCDSIAFVFCFEEPSTFEAQVWTTNGMTTVRVSTTAEGEIHITPWTLSVESYTGFIVGYRRDGYPDHLKPVLVPYNVTTHA